MAQLSEEDMRHGIQLLKKAVIIFESARTPQTARGEISLARHKST
jgi:hypothetical protein